ncbi:MAG: pilus assembly protein TadE [Bowdeniella nasicola]|nr:pilus assembly protein TadE [Bowdeniella nasicola]
MRKLPLSQARDRERGSAVVEFVAVTVILLIPAAYAILTLFQIQSAHFAADGTAREAARIISEARDEGRARAHVAALARLSAYDLGLEPDAVRIRLTCEASPCLSAEALIDVEVVIERPLPLIPAFLASRLPASVRVGASAVGVVNPYLQRSEP